MRDSPFLPSPRPRERAVQPGQVPWAVMADEQHTRIVDVDTTDDFLDRPDPLYGPDAHPMKSGRELDEAVKGRVLPKLPPLTDH